MKAKEVNSIQDAERFCTGVINDFESGVSTKEETMEQLKEYTWRLHDMFESTIEKKAKELLADKGFYTDNLWCIEDVKHEFECTDEEAYSILDGALNNEATMEQIWFAINMYKEDLKTQKDG